MQFTGEVTSVVVEINMTGLYETMIGRLRQLSEPRLRRQAGIETSQTPVERDFLHSLDEIRGYLLKNSAVFHVLIPASNRPFALF